MLKAELQAEVDRLTAENADLRSQLKALPEPSNDYRLGVLTEGEILYMVLHKATSTRQFSFVPSYLWVGDKDYLNEQLAFYLNNARYDRKLVGIEDGLDGVLNAGHLENAEIEVIGG